MVKTLNPRIRSVDIIDEEILNADVNSAAAIAYPKLNLSGSVRESDIKGGLSGADLVFKGLKKFSSSGRVPDSSTNYSHNIAAPVFTIITMRSTGDVWEAGNASGVLSLHADTSGRDCNWTVFGD